MKARTQQEFAKKWTGLVNVITGQTTAKFTTIRTDKEGKLVKFPDGSDTLKVKLADLPKEAKRVIKATPDGVTPTSKEFRVRLNEDGDGVETVTPARGIFSNCKMVGLGPKDKDGNWRPMIHKIYNEGTAKQNEHDEFFAVYEILDGPFKGVELPAYYLHYKYEEIPEGEEDEGMTRWNTVDTPQASQLHKLQAWEKTQGNITGEMIVWPDDGDIRPELEERALSADVTVTLVFEKGYIDSVQPSETYEEEETEEEFDKEFPAEDEQAEKRLEKEEVVEVPAKGKKTAKTVVRSAVAKGKNTEEDDL